jgi:hypothetical protein
MSRLSSLAAKLAETLADGGWRAKARPFLIKFVLRAVTKKTL